MQSTSQLTATLCCFLLGVFILPLVQSNSIPPRVKRDAVNSYDICNMLSETPVAAPTDFPPLETSPPDHKQLALKSAQRSEIASDQCKAAQRVIVEKPLNGDSSLLHYLVSRPHRPISQISFFPIAECEKSEAGVSELLQDANALIQRIFTAFLITDHVLKEIHRYQLYHVDYHFLGRADHQAVVDAIYHGPMANVRQTLCRITEVAASRKLQLDQSLPSAATSYQMPDFQKGEAYFHAWIVLEDTRTYLEFVAYTLTLLAEAPVP